jgi:hypothetical protein
MLQGIAANEIIVGAYTSGEGICPMLAAHRNGGRTNLISFAKAWDRFAFTGSRVTKPRPATVRELLVLRSHLEASLLDEDTPQADLASAIQAHRELVSRRGPELPRMDGHVRGDIRAGDRHAIKATDRRAQRRTRRTRPGDPDRSRELRSQPGWHWTRLVRRYDEYQWALEQVRAQQEVSSPQQEPSPQVQEETPVLS